MSEPNGKTVTMPIGEFVRRVEALLALYDVWLVAVGMDLATENTALLRESLAIAAEVYEGRSAEAKQRDEAHARAEKAEAILIEYAKRTDPLLFCGDGDDPSSGQCGKCKSCLMDYKREAEALLTECREALKAARSYYIWDHRLGGKEADDPEVARWDALIAKLPKENQE